MKLLDLMLTNGVSWYRDATHAAQDMNGFIWFYGKEPTFQTRGVWDSNGHVYGDSKVNGLVIADDWNSCVITKGQYTAALRLARTVESVLAAPPEHPDVFAFKKWYAETLPVVEAMAAGMEVEYTGPRGWVPKIESQWYTGGKYRIKPQPPKTININGYEVPEPLRCYPPKGTTVYSVSGAGPFGRQCWIGDIYQRKLLVRGMLHDTKEAAELHSNALASFTQEGD